ncbi:heterokaryon incompatibility protein [Colletotrichum graminicola]|uniref:Heterokaryon incompatibility protein n=1 Tax=Colletotrichum graminicola (strain M1.001 / M2 / FGSC 10212) TaxID=645133 RepID=E3Q265_COLGM|nr:heterokaryon incompatibility protein [Colletotrichum graminicola M1.001]EFQ25166.1 heterokaryon incompatibility protein [Colletotrichum graminicola M1.001]WDK15212.1 heterokaryon incompatibility protein [Colletotrichum graminicola]
MPSIYTRRLPSRWIRILALQGGCGDSPIHVRLREANVDSLPSFAALSYVWGDPSQQQQIRVSGHEVFVTKNLFDALRHFRLPDQELMLWADALCINQGDLEERADQVQLMREIYSRAATVLVWLGLDGDEGQAARAIPLMESIHQACEDRARARGVALLAMAHFTPATERLEGLAGVSIPDIAAVAERAGRPGPDPEGWAAIRWVLSRPWFTRVWCVQEIVLARASKVCIGSHSFDWVKLGVTASWLSEQSIASDYDVPPELEGMNWDAAYSMFDTSDLSESSLLEVLVAFRDLVATDPRDKVYGLLGLVSHEALARFPGVDYRKSVAEVYGDVVRASVDSSGTLAPLSYAKHGHEYVRTEIPSWVPRWDASEDVCSILHDFSVTAWENGDKHGLPGLADFEPTADGRVALSGVRFDSIAWVTEMLDIVHFKEDIPSPEAAKHPFLDIWHRASSNNCYVLSASADHPYNGISEMGLTLTAGFTDVYELVGDLGREDLTRFRADFLTYIRQLFDKAGKKPETFNPLDIRLSNGDATRFRIAASRSCDQRRVFETTAGFYGLAPACAREGDVVVLLYGGPVPFVLRQVAEGWVLLGDGFVGPLMPEMAVGSVRERFSHEEVFVLV